MDGLFLGGGGTTTTATTTTSEEHYGIKKIKKGSCEIVDFVGSHICNQCWVLGSRVPRVLCDFMCYLLVPIE